VEPDLSDPKAIEAHFLAALPRIEKHAKTKFRGMTPEALDDAIQKVRGLAWKYYLREVERGKNPDDYISVIADFSVRHVKGGRDVTGIERMQDVLSHRGQKQRGYKVQSFPEHDTSPDESVEALKNWRETPPDDAAAFHHDFPLFVKALPQKQADVVLDAALGDTTTELSEKHKISQSRVSQIRTQAREKWSELALPPDERER
jgi:hypothetical protein